MKKEYSKTHETVKSIFEALNYQSNQIGAALNIPQRRRNKKRQQ